MSQNSVKFQSAVLFVRDVGVSRRFYEGLLGQQVLMDHGPNVGFVGGFAIWQVDHAAGVMAGDQAGDPGDFGRGGCELYFESEELDAVHSALAGEGVREVHPVREQPWGQRVLRVYDPDGYIVEVGEPMYVVVRRYLAQGMSAEDVAARTSMPLEVVRQIAGL